MVSKGVLKTFLDKKVFIKIIDDKVQVGVLRLEGEEFYLEGRNSKTYINPEQIARITNEFGGAE